MSITCTRCYVSALLSAPAMTRMVTIWSQTGKTQKLTERVGLETLYSKGIAGAPGRTMLELFF